MAYAPDPRDDAQGIVRLVAASWEGFGAVNIRRHPGHHSVIHGAVALALPLIHLPGARIEIDGLRQRHTDSRRGTHCVIPTGAGMRGAWSCRTDYLILKLEDAFLDGLHAQGEATQSSRQVEPRAGIDDPAVFRLGLLLMEELENGGARGRLYREALGTAVATAALGRAMGPAGRMRAAEPPARLRNAIEFLGENLHADLSVLAEIVALKLGVPGLTREAALSWVPRPATVEAVATHLVECATAPNTHHLRASVGPGYLRYLELNNDRIAFAGQLYDDPKGSPTGRMYFVRSDDPGEARAYIESSPYFVAGMYAGCRVKPFRAILGSMLGGVGWPEAASRGEPQN